MEEKAVRKINWLSVASLLLGMYSLVTSLWSTSILQYFPGNYGPWNAWVESTAALFLCAGAGLMGILLGVPAYRRAEGRKGIPVLGILLSGAGFCMELPFLLLYLVMGSGF